MLVNITSPIICVDKTTFLWGEHCAAYFIYFMVFWADAKQNNGTTLIFLWGGRGVMSRIGYKFKVCST